MMDSVTITFTDVVGAVVNYFRGQDHEDRDAFIGFECDRWVGERWEDAGSWDIARDWVTFQVERI